jgi:hypothetical protein
MQNVPIRYSPDVHLNNGFGDQDMMFVEQFDSTQGIGASSNNEASLSPVVSQNALLNRTSLTPTAVESIAKYDADFDVPMQGIENSEFHEQICYGMVS